MLKLKYALNNNAKISFQEVRYIDINRKIIHTNRYTISKLFPNENPIIVLERELKLLSVEDYIETVKDLRFPNKQEMRVFGKKYQGYEDVYIKIRVELIDSMNYGGHTVFVMSFHFAEYKLEKSSFPYKN